MLQLLPPHLFHFHLLVFNASLLLGVCDGPSLSAMHRDRRLLILIVPVLVFLLLATGLYLGHDHLSRITKLHIPFLSDDDPTGSDAAQATAPTTTPSTATSIATSAPTPTPTPPKDTPLSGIKDGQSQQPFST
jgi:alpha-1,3-mannosyltransferase